MLFEHDIGLLNPLDTVCRAGQYGVGEIGTAVEEEELPSEAHHTLFMSGLPMDIQKREATHIFRPFEGYKVNLSRITEYMDSGLWPALTCSRHHANVTGAVTCRTCLCNLTLYLRLQDSVDRIARQKGCESMVVQSCCAALNSGMDIWKTVRHGD